MNFHARQLPNGRWGIYYEVELLASVGCHRTCEKIIFHLKNPERKKPSKTDLLGTKQQERIIRKRAG